MCTTTLKETFNGKQFLDHFDATYGVKSSLGTVTEIKIPTSIAAALNDTSFSYQWLMAIQNELQQKFADGYEFETVITMVMEGTWIFETEANSDIAAIDFKAKIGSTMTQPRPRPWPIKPQPRA